ncbi:MAG TPA: hypothetical protein ENL09_02175 [Bacteroidetes bacterium]|nr:hypothetical protein [Bacteroidota bacterium]
MKFKKNPIFWWASGIFVLGLILFAITQNQIFALAFIVAAYLLRPTLASLGLAKKYVDERQTNLNYRSSNIAFIVMMVACVFFAGYLMAKDDHTFEMFLMVIVIGIATKALFNVLLSKLFREVAPKIIIGLGLLVSLFSGMGAIHHGIFSMNFLMNALPGLMIAGLGILSKYFPRVIAVVLFFILIALVIFILRRGIDWATIGGSLIIGVPLLAASLGLWREPKKTSEEVSE